MEELQSQIAAQVDRLDQEVEIFLDQLEALSDECGYDQVALAVMQAKRVRKELTLTLRQLAQLRDNLQPGGTR